MIEGDKIIKVGDCGATKYGCIYKAIEVLNSLKVIIEFQDDHKHISEVFTTNFKNGTVWNPYQITLYGHGYVGDGPYLASKSGRDTPEYTAWRNVFKRCYHEPYQRTHPSYIDCSVAPEWHNYQIYAQWWHENHYDVPGEKVQFDKDILVKGNRVYCPERCLFVPQRINLIFQGKRLSNQLATGVLQRGNKYAAMYNTKSLGTFESLEEAVSAHDEAKRQSIMRVANEYKSRIPNRVYEALINY